MESGLQTPIVFLIFNRPDATERVFAEISSARPRTLLIVADGPRTEQERKLCNQTRAIVEKIDWDCTVHREYAEFNLGCGKRVASGISWAFNIVERAIILEDDCLPAQDFFIFCEEMLERYAETTRVGMISGNNFGCAASNAGDSYFFSRYHHIWGWATWRRAWTQVDSAMSDWPQLRAQGWPRKFFRKFLVSRHWTRLLDRTYQGEIDTWDFRMFLSFWRHNMLGLMPIKNLVTNIGFGPSATHTTKSLPWQVQSREKLDRPIVHPVTVAEDTHAVAWTERSIIGISLKSAVKDELRYWMKRYCGSR